ncbi:hypothetical protein PINS_up015554 [Pythium insidiosum]|nr:hypothetical protein PINS_up015554 [Pythium insidiosum]
MAAVMAMRRQLMVSLRRSESAGIDAPVNYSFEERVFSTSDTPEDKAKAKMQVVESLKSTILSGDKPAWNTSTSNYDNMQMTGKCYKRTNVNAERNRVNMFAYNFRAEQLPKKWPTIKRRQTASIWASSKSRLRTSTWAMRLETSA